MYFHFTDQEAISFFENNPLAGFEEIIDKFNAMPTGANKADLFRMYFLYLKGGVFLDSDAMLNVPISEITQDYTFFSVDSYVHPGTLFQGLIGAEPGHPYIEKVLRIGYKATFEEIQNDYYFFCQKHHFFAEDQRLDSDKLYPECFYDQDVYSVLNDRGKILALHYWRYKVIPFGSKKIIPKDSIRKKNLIYVTLHGADDYAALFDLFFTSLLLHTTQAWNFTFLIQTSQRFLKKIEYLKCFPLDIQIWVVADKKDIFQAATARYEIFNFSDIARYRKILYLDIDILIGGPVAHIFDQAIQANKIYCLPEDQVSSVQDYYGKSLFDQEGSLNFHHKFGFTSAVILFINSPSIPLLFSDVIEHATADRLTGKSHIVFDQAYLNFHAISRNAQELDLLQGWAQNNPEIIKPSICVYHFPGIPGSYLSKVQKMSAFLMQIFEGIAISKKTWLTAMDFLNRPYSDESKTQNYLVVAENLSVLRFQNFVGFCVIQPYSEDVMLVEYPGMGVTNIKTELSVHLPAHYLAILKNNELESTQIDRHSQQEVVTLSDNMLVEQVLSRRTQFLDHLVDLKRKEISDWVSIGHNNTVAYGPFKGMRLSVESHWGASDRGAMVLGLYEQELLSTLSRLPLRKKALIDLGAGDGYYGVGGLVGGIFERSYCFEISPRGREIIAKNADLNQVASNLHIFGEATKQFYKQLPPDAISDSVLLIDIEGAEFDIVDQETFKIFSSSLIIIEIHLWMPDIHRKVQRLIDDARLTHTSEKILMSTRDLSAFTELNSLNDNSRWLLCSEGRPHLMYWLKFEPNKADLAPGK